MKVVFVVREVRGKYSSSSSHCRFCRRRHRHHHHRHRRRRVRIVGPAVLRQIAKYRDVYFALFLDLNDTSMNSLALCSK